MRLQAGRHEVWTLTAFEARRERRDHASTCVALPQILVTDGVLLFVLLTTASDFQKFHEQLAYATMHEIHARISLCVSTPANEQVSQLCIEQWEIHREIWYKASPRSFFFKNSPIGDSNERRNPNCFYMTDRGLSFAFSFSFLSQTSSSSGHYGYCSR